MVRNVLITLALVLAGCAPPEPFIHGVAIQAPSGWVGYCARHDADPDCKLTTQPISEK
jgi:hypothetical protein